MPAASEPENETTRLEALKLYDIMDSMAEEQYEQIVQLASYICDVPIALISFVDKDRQWFKARVGLDAQETHRDAAFCAHAILKPDEMLIVEDASKDERFADSALVLDHPNIRFYAGYPLNTESGHALGTLCVIDSKPKQITQKQKETLKILGDNVVTLLGAVEMNETMFMVMDSLKDSIDNTSADISYDDLPTIETNQLLILRVLQNLIANAIKYQAAGNKPVVNVSIQKVDNRWRFCVKDNGIGIEEKHFKEIFHAFKRLHGRGVYDGTGMGLAICQKIIDDLGGEIWVESQIGEGASFYFTIPTR